MKAARGLRRFSARSHPPYRRGPPAPVTTGDLCTRSRPPRGGGPGEQFRRAQTLCAGLIYISLATRILPAATPMEASPSRADDFLPRIREAARRHRAGPPCVREPPPREPSMADAGRNRLFRPGLRLSSPPTVRERNAPARQPDRSGGPRPGPGAAAPGTTRIPIERGGGIPADRRARAPDAKWAEEQHGQCRPRLWRRWSRGPGGLRNWCVVGISLRSKMRRAPGDSLTSGSMSAKALCRDLTRSALTGNDHGHACKNTPDRACPRCCCRNGGAREGRCPCPPARMPPGPAAPAAR